MRTAVGIIAAAVLGSLLPLGAQEKPVSASPAVYQVEFNIRDGGEGAAQPNQHYMMVIDESRKGTFQAGNRVQATVGDRQGPYLDVGVKIDCSVRESDGKVALSGNIELSKIDGQVDIGGIAEPIVGQTKMAFQTSVEPGTPALIGSAAKYQMEATVTKLQ
jgi:hypothetical protein